MDKVPPIHQANGRPLEDHAVENFRPLRVVIIGAGFSGIYLGIRIPQLLRNVHLTIYDKNMGVGGTWWENRYPGCACDIPAHSYVFSFEPNPNWSSFYASSGEIQKYLEGVVGKYSVNRFIKLGHKVYKCTWDEGSSKWLIEIDDLVSGERFTDKADVLINSGGLLNNFKWPDLNGLSTFKGKVVHSAAWDEKFDYSNKRIGIIGGGSSAIQIIPQLQKLEGNKLVCFIRSKTWISYLFGHAAQQKLKMEDSKSFSGDREEYTKNPELYHQVRKLIETEGNLVHPFTLKGSEASEGLRIQLTSAMRERLAKSPALADFLIPSFAPGCRRLTPGPGYLEALTKDNVQVVHENIRSILASGVDVEDGRIFDLDVLVCATGFDVGSSPVDIIGLGGQTLKERYTPYPETYMSMAVDGFPNLFMVLGHNAGVASGSLTTIIEHAGDYAIKCIRKIQKENIASMRIAPERVRDWVEYVDMYFKTTVFMDDCKTWYRRDDRIIGLWPGSNLHAIETLRSPRWEDWIYATKNNERNRLWWIGNGWSELQLNGGDVSYYIEPEFIDFPSAPLPEESKKWTTLPFSY